MAVKRTTHQRKVLYAIKSMLADVSSVSPSSEQSGLWVRREFVTLCLFFSLFFVFLLLLLLLFFVCSLVVVVVVVILCLFLFLFFV